MHPGVCSQTQGPAKEKAVSHLLELKADCPLEQNIKGSASILQIASQATQSSENLVEAGTPHPEI